MKTGLIIVSGAILFGWISAVVQDLKNLHKTQMIDSDYEKQWEKEITLKEKQND